jgi:hypothetical protein
MTMAPGWPRSLGAALAAASWLAAVGSTLADSPGPTQAAIGDPRAGQSAGFVGDPGLAIAVVVVIAIATVAVTLAWVRATGGPSRQDEDQ